MREDYSDDCMWEGLNVLRGIQDGLFDQSYKQLNLPFEVEKDEQR